jgi:hypothetical protein
VPTDARETWRDDPIGTAGAMRGYAASYVTGDPDVRAGLLGKLGVSSCPSSYEPNYILAPVW